MKPKPYVIDPPVARGNDTVDGPWRLTPFGNRYATVTLADGRKFFVGVERDKPVRIPFKPRGANRGWTYHGFVRESITGKVFLSDAVNGSIGVRGLLRFAGLLVTEEVAR